MPYASKTSEIPNNTVLGLRQISRQLGNIRFSREVNDFLSEIDGRIEMSYTPESGTISHKIVSARNGENLAQTAEFERLGKYRSMVNKAKDDEEENSRKDSAIAVYHNMMINYNTKEGKPPPARMLAANQTKFGNMRKSLKIIEENIKVVETLTTSKYKTYILDKANDLRKAYVQGLVACFGDEKYEQATHEGVVFMMGIPKYMESKLTDRSFAKDAKHDALPLIFPKGNFVKSLSFKTDELKANHFVAANACVLENSQAIVGLARSDEVRDWFIPDNNRMKDDLREQWKKFTWPMLSPGTVDTFLDPRIKGISVRTFSSLNAPREKPGQDSFRPEGVMQKEVRSIKNQQMKLVSTMLDFFHFIPRTSDPLGDFWSTVTNTSTWDITPDKTIYGWLNEVANKDTLLGLVLNNETGKIKVKLAEVVLTNMGVPAESNRYKAMKTILEAAADNNAAITQTDDADRVTNIDAMLDVSIANLENVASMNDTARVRVNEFCGKVTEEAIRNDKRDRMNSKSLLSKTARKIIKRIQDDVLQKAAAKWLREDFSNDKLREVAARYFVAAASDLSLGNMGEDDDSSSSDEEEEN